MQKIFIRTLAAIIFFIGNVCSAAAVSLSDDNLATFLEKCNQELKIGDPESYLDLPTLSSTENNVLKYYTDDFEIDGGVPITITYMLRDEKIYSIMLESNVYDENVQKCFAGLNIIFLKSAGLTADEASGLTNSGSEKEWKRDGRISRLNKRYSVTLYAPTLFISAESNP